MVASLKVRASAEWLAMVKVYYVVPPEKVGVSIWLAGQEA